MAVMKLDQKYDRSKGHRENTSLIIDMIAVVARPGVIYNTGDNIEHAGRNGADDQTNR